MSDFTKGPWHAERLETTDGHMGIYPKRTRSLQSAHEIARVWGDRRDSDEVEANARLMAASSAMYEALGNLLNALDRHNNAAGPPSSPPTYVGEAMIDARAALAKARGDDD